MANQLWYTNNDNIVNDLNTLLLIMTLQLLKKLLQNKAIEPNKLCKH